MDTNAQSHLAGLIADARVGAASHPSEDWAGTAFRGFSSAMAALVAVGAVSKDESEEWTSRMLVALGEEPLQPAPPGVTAIRFISVGPRPPRPPDPPPESTFLGLVPVHQPDRPLAYGGRVQILGLERYDTKAVVAWRLAPEPDYEFLFADELAAQEGDTDGLSDFQRDSLRRQLLHRLKTQRRHLRLTDDLGTAYHQMGGGSSGGGGEQVGRSMFVPAIPDSACRVSVLWDDLEFVVAL